MPKINQLDKELAVMKKQMEDHCRSNDENFTGLKADIKEVKNETNEIKKSIENWLEKADNRYASKLTEQLFYSTLGAVIVYIIYYVLKMTGIS